MRPQTEAGSARYVSPWVKYTNINLKAEVININRQLPVIKSLVLSLSY